MESNTLRIEPDGSHLIPLVNVRHSDGDQHSNATGFVRWSAKDGITYEINLPGVGVFEQSRFAPSSRTSGGVGTVSNVIEEANWIGQTADGMEVRIYSMNEVPESSQTSSWSAGSGGSLSAETVIRGTAIYASVELPSDSPLAFWNWTTPCTRICLPGTEYDGWQVSEDFEFKKGDSFSRTQRGITHLSNSPKQSLVSFKHNGMSEGGLWITDHSSVTDDELWYSKQFSQAVDFVSLLHGQRLPVFWKDQFLDSTRLRRIYYGCSIWRDSLSGVEQLIPLANCVERLKYGKEISGWFIPLFTKYREISAEYDLNWIVSPIQTAFKTIVDDKLALTCVSLERLATAHAAVMKKNQVGKPYVFLTKQQAAELIAELSKTLDVASASLQISVDRVAILKKKLASIGQAPNADKLKQVWIDLGIAVSDEEQKVIKNRDKSLHGSPTLIYDGENNNANEEAKRFDVLRTLIHKAILTLLGYEGPYFDYGTRPSTGNYPVRYLNKRKPEVETKQPDAMEAE